MKFLILIITFVSISAHASCSNPIGNNEINDCAVQRFEKSVLKFEKSVEKINELAINKCAKKSYIRATEGGSSYTAELHHCAADLIDTLSKEAKKLK